MRNELDRRIEQVLDGLRFPAHRWQIVTQADMYGVDTTTRKLIHTLPPRVYRDLADVSSALPPTEPPTRQFRTHRPTGFRDRARLTRP